MSIPLSLYTNPRSRGRIARWMLEEVGQPYDTVVTETPAILAYPPLVLRCQVQARRRKFRPPAA
jgi:hypothetical protein